MDASVVVQWVLRERDAEEDGEKAIALLEAIRRRDVRVVQPVHWLVEAAAVLTRLSPATATTDVMDLFELELPIEQGADAYAEAVELACSLPHHLFDTLYHGVALVTPGARLVTADESYFAKAFRRGSIVRLRSLRIP